MLRILSDLTITSRVDLAPDATTLAATGYKQGQWLNAAAAKPGTYGYVPFGCVFNMNESTTVLSKDATAVAYDSAQDATIGGAEKITVITGPFRGVTDQVSTAGGTPSAGDPLTVVSGLLCAVTLPITTQHVVAVVEEVLTAFEHRGASYAAWRFKTV